MVLEVSTVGGRKFYIDEPKPPPEYKRVYKSDTELYKQLLSFYEKCVMFIADNIPMLGLKGTFFVKTADPDFTWHLGDKVNKDYHRGVFIIQEVPSIERKPNG